MFFLASVGFVAVANAGGAPSPPKSLTCGALRDHYKTHECCGNPNQEAGGYQLVPAKPKGSGIWGANPCAGQNPLWANEECFDDDNVFNENITEQAPGDVSDMFKGFMYVGTRVPINVAYRKSANHLCPVNVHWHIGAEHRSVGEYDENGKSPELAGTPMTGGKYRYGLACHHYDADDAKFVKPYDWKHCVDMHVGETYEVHWPHSSLGACGTPWQFQSPFYDGVFCNGNDALYATLTPQDIANNIGVQAQIFTIVNDEAYYYPNLMWGMIVDGDKGTSITRYTGSTTGTSRNNVDSCSKYSPITWQVDRKCHLISASSFDKMCADMKQQRDDMSSDLHAHGAREVVSMGLSGDNQVGNGY